MLRRQDVPKLKDRLGQGHEETQLLEHRQLIGYVAEIESKFGFLSVGQ